jgi:hypothetical protein
MALTKINNNTLSAITGLPAGVGGKVLQVVTATNTSQITVSTGSYTWTTNISLAITPSSTSNKILILGSQNLATNQDDKYMNGTFFKNSTNLGHSSFGISGGSLAVGVSFIAANWGASYLDSPSSTSEITYHMKGAAQTATGYMNVNGSYGTLTLMEVAG